MIICICHRVSDRDISRAVREGCGSFEELQFELGVATGCGACGSCAQATFHELHGAAADMPADSGHGHSHAQGRGHAHSHTLSHAAPPDAGTSGWRCSSYGSCCSCGNSCVIMAATPNGSVSRAAVPAARTGACASASNTGASNTRTRWHSSQLLGAAREVEIEHGDATYRLRVTSMGKLILTK